MASRSTWQLEANQATLAGLGATLRLDRPEEGIQQIPGVGGSVTRGGGSAGVRATNPGAPGLLCLRPTSAPGARLALKDAYTRGSDLVACYAPSEGFPYETEVYWRVERVDAARGTLLLTLILSVETQLLDSRPAVTVSSHIAATHAATHAADAGLAADAGRAVAEVVGGLQPRVSPDGGSILTPLPAAGGDSVGDTPRAWLEAVHPSDQAEAQLETLPLAGAADTQAGAAADTNASTAGHRWRLFERFLEKGVIRRARLSAALVAGDQIAEQAAQLREEFGRQEPPLTV